MAVQPAAAEHRDAILALITAQQARLDRNVPSLGDTPTGIAAELDDLDPPWIEAAGVVLDGGVVGAVVVELDERLGRAWILGPWVDRDDPDAWAATARALVEWALERLPAAVRDIELSGVVEHRGMADLAATLGFPASEVNYALVVTAEHLRSTRPSGRLELRPVTADDLGWVHELHELEFPKSYDDAASLLARAAEPGRTVLVAEDETGEPLGYAAGRIQPDGEGYLDFVAVRPTARGRGAGEALVVAISQSLLAEAPSRRVSLTVQEGRVAARALYARIGFEVDLAMVGYRARPD